MLTLTNKIDMLFDRRKETKLGGLAFDNRKEETPNQSYSKQSEINQTSFTDKTHTDSF